MLPIPSRCAHSGQQESFTEVIIAPLGILEKNSTATSDRTLTFAKGCFKALKSGSVGHTQSLACLLIQDGIDHKESTEEGSRIRHRSDVMGLPTSAITRQASERPS